MGQLQELDDFPSSSVTGCVRGAHGYYRVSQPEELDGFGVRT